MSKTIIFIYTTAPNLKTAKKISRILLKEKLIACANILPNMTSLYWWKNKVTEEGEVVLILKSSKSKLKKIQNRIHEVHPYQIPCIAEIHLKSINDEYKDWLLNSLE